MCIPNRTARKRDGDREQPREPGTHGGMHSGEQTRLQPSRKHRAASTPSELSTPVRRAFTAGADIQESREGGVPASLRYLKQLP